MTKEQLEEMVDELTVREVAALIRCADGQPFRGEGEIKELRKLELIMKNSWAPTELGFAVVGHLVGKDLVSGSSRGASRSSNVRTVSEGVVQRQGVCVGCGKEIKGGERCTWVSSKGMFHPGCVPGPKGKFEPEEGARVFEATSARKASCTQCGGELEKNDECVWVADVGIFHPNCINLSNVKEFANPRGSS